jgi:hypothetical protein
MGSRSHRLASVGAGALATLVVLGPATPALAGGPGDDLGSVAGINYHGKLFPDSPVGSFGSFAGCADGDAVIGGGGEIEGLGSQGAMGSTYWAAEGGPRFWRTSLRNVAGGAKDMRFFAICKKSGNSGLRFVTKKRRNVQPGEKRSVKARCPDGYRVIGGGIFLASPSVTATLPFDGRDRDSKPDDGWKASGVNNDAIARTLEARAVCRKAGTWKLAYASVGVGVAGGTTSLSGQLCAEGTVVGGGASITGPTGTVRIHESYPHDGADADIAPDDAWFAGLTNLEMAQASGRVHAICKV